MSETTTQTQRRVLLEKARLLWRLVTTTSGVTDLAEPMARVERDFERLSKGQRTTIAVIAQMFDRGCHEIDTNSANNEVKKEEVKETIEVVEVTSPQKNS